jgi:hypothetical protein
MLKKPASFVFVSLNASTYEEACLSMSLAVALLDGRIEHPASASRSRLF